MMKKIKQFFIKIKPSKRKLIQLYAALLYNANIKGYITGEIFKGNSKSVCLPGLNCYSCPGAIGACPLGSLQNALSESKTKVSTYVLGIILLYSIILGRTICGFLCPVGLIQELLYKIKTPKLKKSKVTRILSYFKYILLLVLVIILPLIYALKANNIPLPAFCKYICPAGTLEGAILLLSNPNNNSFFGMLGVLFTWKFTLLVIFIIASIFIFRFFCRFFCPLGALYGLFNKISILGVKVDKTKCNSCQACVTHCKMDIKEVGDHECIQCGECRKVCPCKAIDWKAIRKLVKEDLDNKDLDNKDKIENLENIKDSEDLSIDNINKSQKKDLRISVKTFNTIIAVILSVTLIITLIVVNFRKEVYKVNDVCNNLDITLIENNQKFNIKEDTNATILYFYNEINNYDIELLSKYADENLLVILISDTSDTKLDVDNFKDDNILVCYDNDNKTIKLFTEIINYPYIVFMDTNDKIIMSQSKMITDDDYITTILPIISGNEIGNQVGNICYNKEINIIDSDESFTVANNKGKIVVINFWYTSCTPCVAELPYFDKVYKKYQDDVVVIAIHSGGLYESDPDGVKEFINTQFKDFTIIFGYDDVLAPYYEILGGTGAYPMTLIIDQDGMVSYNNPGSITESELENEINKLLE